MKIGAKVLAGFSLALLITVTVGAVGLVNAQRITVRLDDVAKDKFPSSLALANVSEAQAKVGRSLATLHLTRMSEDVRRVVYASLEQDLKEIEDAARRYEALPQDGGAVRLWGQVRGAMPSWVAAVNATVALLRERDRLIASGQAAGSAEVVAVEAREWESFQGARELFVPLDEAVDVVTGQTTKDVDASNKAGEDAASTAVVLIVTVMLLGGVLMLALGFLLSQAISAGIKALLSETGKLTEAARAGEFGVRGNTQAASVEFRPIVAGINDIIDSMTGPLRVAVDHFERISHGELPPLRTNKVSGEVHAMQVSLNRCITSVSSVVADTQMLVEAAIEGKLSTRADASKHQGDFRKIVAGVNGTLDAVMKPIEEATAVMEKLAVRDLTARVKGNYQGDHTRIKDALNATAEALHESLAQVAQAVSQVSAAAGQIASSSEAVASGASEQASSLEETSSSLESMTGMTKQAADNAQQANGLAQTAKSAATEGGAAMEQMTGAMGRIKASAEGTSQIIKDINEIAFQTNLLALNAAVEAARAGEAGRGFAVVAEEVRSLAMRSKEAAQKTEDLIRQSVKEAGEGEVTAKHVNQKLGEIGVSISKVSAIVAEIAASAKEQAAGIEQVNLAVGQMDQVTQQNAANSEQSSSAAAELSGQSEELAAMLGSFQLERGTVAAKTSAPRAPLVARMVPRAAKLLAPHPKRASAKPGPAGRGIAVRPEDVIPMDGDPAFKEF